jgi:hypothetical protein
MEREVMDTYPSLQLEENHENFQSELSFILSEVRSTTTSERLAAEMESTQTLKDIPLNVVLFFVECGSHGKKWN